MLDYFLENFSKEINGIIHVGAHSGQEVLKYKAYDKKIILFEPQKSIYKELLKNVASLQEVQCYNIGLGSVKKKSTLFKSNENEGKSSSVLTPELHLKVQPNISFTDSEEIKIVKKSTKWKKYVENYKKASGIALAGQTCENGLSSTIKKP